MSDISQQEQQPDEPEKSTVQASDGLESTAPDNEEGNANPPIFSGRIPLQRANTHMADVSLATSRGSISDRLTPTANDRVFPIRSVISVDPVPSPPARHERVESFFRGNNARRMSLGTNLDTSHPPTPARQRNVSSEVASSPKESEEKDGKSRQVFNTLASESPFNFRPHQAPRQYLNDIITGDTDSVGSGKSALSGISQDRAASNRGGSAKSVKSVKSVKSDLDDIGPLVTARFTHVVSEGGHAIITGRDGDTLQRCEDEPIHIPGAVQGFGVLVALEEQTEGKLLVRVVSENCKAFFGYSPRQLFELDSFTDILTEDQADNLLDHIDFIRDEDADVVTNGPEVFTLSVRTLSKKNIKLWCAMHVNERNRNLIICEFELEDDPVNPLVPPGDHTPEPPEDTLDSRPTEEEYTESTHNYSKPLRVLRSARKRRGEAAAMEVFNIMSQVQEQLAAAPNLDRFLKILVGVVKELTGFHRVMVYQFDQQWNGRVVTELVDPRATKDLYKGLNFPASDIPKQARDLYKINKVRMLYDRDQETARLVCRTLEDLETPLDLTHSYLRAMSPIHIKYLANMAVRSSMSISINAFDELWGLIACHTYGSRGMRVSFPIRKMCRLVGDSASRNIERLSYASRLQARKLINTVPTQANPSGYIIASSEDLLKLFDADFGLLSIRDETKILGNLDNTQEILVMLEYLRVRSITSVMTSSDIKQDFPDLRYPPGFSEIAGLLLVPLTTTGQDFIVFFRRGQLKEVKWAGNPYEKFVKEGTEGYLEPRKSFKTWSETVVGKCREWTEEEIETAAVLCLVYGKFIEVWRQKEAALQNSQLTKLLLANSAHEVRTPLNAIINYLEIALEGTLDQETRENLAKSHSASKSLIYVINDLLDLTKTEEGGDLVKEEVFNLSATLYEATDSFKGDAKRKNITYEVVDHPGLPAQVIGDQRKVRQAISNVTANAIQNTVKGGVTVDMYVASRQGKKVDIEISIADTGSGISNKRLDALFRELEQVEGDPNDFPETPGSSSVTSPSREEGKALGLGLAVVARIIRNMNGQLRLKSEEGKGSRFIIQFPFEIPETDELDASDAVDSLAGTETPQVRSLSTQVTPTDDGMVTLIDRGSTQRRNSSDTNNKSDAKVIRRTSFDSFGSKQSFGSKSWSSKASGRSEADRLIEAIQEPHRVEGWHEDNVHRSSIRSSVSTGKSRPKIMKRHTSGGALLSKENAIADTTERVRLEPRVLKPGESAVRDQGVPIKSIRVPEDHVPSSAQDRPSSVPADLDRLPEQSSPVMPKDGSVTSDTPANAELLRVLVAEDDPVNSRIIQKRLEKLKHMVTLTGNGEECSGTYCDNTGDFDFVLMDMQVRCPYRDGRVRRSFWLMRETTDADCGWSDLDKDDPIL
jgi:light-regulated signal transduction histidine kinase (bacteriophytochrome)